MSKLPIMLTAVATLVPDEDGGLEPSWLLEGGTAELHADMLLLVADNTPEGFCDDGSAEVHQYPAAVQMREAMERQAARCLNAELHIGNTRLKVTYRGLKWDHWDMAGTSPVVLSIEEFDEILAKELAPC